MRSLPDLSRLLLLLAALPALPALTVDWSPAEAIAVPLLPSTPTMVRTRTVVLPGGSITQVPRFWSDDDFFVQTVDNSLILHLRNPDFSATITVYDDRGDAYLLDVRRAAEDEPIDGMVVVRPREEASGPAAARAKGLIQDSDAAVTEMMRHMLGATPSPHIVGAVVTRVEEGEVKVGRAVFADKDLEIWMVRVYQGAAVRGCELHFRYLGPLPVRLEMERLFFPGALAVHASDQVLLDPARPQVALDPAQTIRVYYVYRD